MRHPIPEILESSPATASVEAQSAVAIARRVLAQEVEGLQAMANGLGNAFTHTVDLVHGLRGRLVVTGMGKSGHVARKIAATLASTGTPAFFVHPGEASHGDLGMIASGDALLMLSNSGETAELRDLIVYASRYGIPILAMVRRKQSVLVDAAAVALVLPETPEASPVGAPTTSTTMMMALGDALAVALLERRGFTPEDFSRFHPGGSLGKRFIRVRDLMHHGEELPLVEEHAGMAEVLLAMTGKHFGCAGVVDASGRLSGIITDGDLRRHLDDALMTRTAREVMTAGPLTIRANSLAAEALGLMNARQITSLFILDENQKPQGILHIHDCLRAGVA